MRVAATVLGVGVLAIGPVAAYNNGVGAKPPMGWNTWCTDDVCGLIDKCSDALVRQQAAAMVSSGMSKLGYQYVNMDDCWAAQERDADGNIQPDPTRFPNGMKALADYVHSLGLKIGVYTCIGTTTCKNNLPGSFGHYEQDAKQFASWGLDFIKCDNCAKPAQYTEQELYTNFSNALNATGRPIFFSLCEWGMSDVQAWGADVGQMYRIQMDHLPFWELPTHAAGMGFGQGTFDIINYIATLTPSTFVKQYGWMDPDFLMTLFNPTMTYTYSKTEFSFWSLWSAPLVVSTNIANMPQDKMNILLNAEVIAIDQDDSHTAGDRVFNKTDGCQAWSRNLANGDKAVILLNGRTPQWIPSPSDNLTISIGWEQIGFTNQSIVAVRDLWAHANLGNFTGSFKSSSLAPADCQMLRVKCLASC